jgi:uncharacterized protein YjbJ (UPF0337 family)
MRGAADKAKGAIKDTAGKVTGDKKLRTEGKIDKGKGQCRQPRGTRERRRQESKRIALIESRRKSRPYDCLFLCPKGLSHERGERAAAIDFDPRIANALQGNDKAILNGDLPPVVPRIAWKPERLLHTPASCALSRHWQSSRLSSGSACDRPTF